MTTKKEYLKQSEILKKYKDTVEKLSKIFKIRTGRDLISEIQDETASNFKMVFENLFGVKIIYEYNQATKRVDVFIMKGYDHISWEGGYGYYEFEPFERVLNFMLPKINFS